MVVRQKLTHPSIIHFQFYWISLTVWDLGEKVVNLLLNLTEGEE